MILYIFSHIANIFLPFLSFENKLAFAKVLNIKFTNCQGPLSIMCSSLVVDIVSLDSYVIVPTISATMRKSNDFVIVIFA